MELGTERKVEQWRRGILEDMAHIQSQLQANRVMVEQQYSSNTFDGLHKDLEDL